MQTEQGNLHLEIQTSRKSPVGVLRTSIWDKKRKKIVHSQHGRITGCSLEQLSILQKAFCEQVVAVGNRKALKILASRELGASQTILALARELGLNKVLYSRREPWVDCVMAMIVGRIVFQGSKLGLCNRWQDTCLWALCGVQGKPEVQKHCYAPLDRLLERQKAIQKGLAKKHLRKGTLVLYDITSSYLEGEYKESELVAFGYNRDRKKGHEQIVVGLITNAQGCPIGCEVFAGNTKDDTTVMKKIDELRKQYQLDHFVFVGDRGMVSQARFEEIRSMENIETISALTHGQLKNLIERHVVQLDLFDERNIAEVSDPEEPALRYCLCKNPVTRQHEHDTRQRLLKLTEEGLEKIADYKKKTTVEILGARVGKLLGKYKMGKFVIWRIERAQEETKSNKHKLLWELDQDKITQEERIDGCYVIRTDVAAKTLDTDSVVNAYKSLGNIERAFRNLKTVQLEMRPIYHKTDQRIRAHVFLCMLSYYVQWHMQQRLQPLFDTDGKGATRRWSFAGIVDCLKQRCRHDVQMDKVTYQQDTELTVEQQEIAQLLLQET